MEQDGLGALERTVVEESEFIPVRTPIKKFRIKNLFRNSAAWGVRTYRAKKDDEYWRHAGLTAISLYIGNLLPNEQRKFAGKMKLDESTFSRYNTTAVYSLFAVPQIGALIASQFSDTNIDDISLMANLGIGGSIDALRAYLAFKKNKPTPAISAFSGAVNFLHYTGKGIVCLTKEAKKQFREIKKEADELMNE